MTSMVFLKDELIIKKNDVGREMYFLVKGKVEVLNRDLTTCYNVIEEGSFFGTYVALAYYILKSIHSYPFC